MASDRADGSLESLEEETVEALHEIELGLEWLQRAHGHLLQFHHATGHAMDHLAAAEQALRAAGRAELANVIRDELLPMGVVDSDRWSYDVVECFQRGLLDDVRSFESRARQALADGHRHVAERRQEGQWKERQRD